MAATGLSNDWYRDILQPWYLFQCTWGCHIGTPSLITAFWHMNTSSWPANLTSVLKKQTLQEDPCKTSCSKSCLLKGRFHRCRSQLPKVATCCDQLLFVVHMCWAGTFQWGWPSPQRLLCYAWLSFRRICLFMLLPKCTKQRSPRCIKHVTTILQIFAADCITKS